MAPLPDVLVGYIEDIVDRRLAAWQEATVAIATPPQPQPAPTGWITDRVPEEGDGDSDGEVRVPPRVGVGCAWIDWRHVHPGTPWIPLAPAPPLGPVIDSPPPWDPTTLDHNGWIRSRLPTAGDAGPGNCLVLIPGDARGYSWQHYTFVTHGQPWAPYGSSPGTYQP
jgi:hypothetical protein